MSYAETDVTVVLFQPEPGKPMEVMPAPDLSRNIAVQDLNIENMGINPLVDQFSWLIASLSCMSSIPWLDDPMPFREQVAREIRKGERKLNEMELIAHPFWSSATVCVPRLMSRSADKSGALTVIGARTVCYPSFTMKHLAVISFSSFSNV